MLGKPRRGERLTPQERAALERLTQPERPQQPERPPQNDASSRLYLAKSKLAWQWTAMCPGCGNKIRGDSVPKPGARLSRCRQCKRVVYLAGG